MKTRRVLGAVLAVVMAAGVVLRLGCTTVEDPWPKESEGKPRVLASFPPLYCFAMNVGGDDVSAKTLLTTLGPHDYPYDSKDLMPLKRANLFLVNGLGLDEGFGGKLVKNADNPRLKMVQLGDVAIPKEERLQLNVRHGNHTHEGDDPHVWLGIPEAIKMVERIAQEFRAIDPSHGADYDRRAKEYVEKLRKLQEDGRAALPGKPEERKIVTTHDAFQYFARTFDVKIVSFIQPRAGQGMNPGDLETLVRQCRDEGVRVITTEPQFPKRDAETLLGEVKNKLGDRPAPHLAELDPLETANPKDLDAGWYERKMRQNLDNLSTAFRQYGAEK